MNTRKLLVEHRVAIDKEIDHYVALYRQQHPGNKNNSSSRLFIDKNRLDYLRSIVDITTAFIQRGMTEDINNKVDFIERIMWQDRQSIADFIERIITV